MKTSKRIAALLTMIVFVVTSVMSFSVFADGFSDVNDSTPYNKAITKLVEEGVINGYEDGTFKPENTITRAEFSKLLAIASAPSSQQFTATTTTFTDVADSSSSSAWAIPYIAYAAQAKIVNGYDEGNGTFTFRPTNPVTYGEAVKMIVCALGYAPVVDTTKTPWYQGYLDVSVQMGLSKGAVALGDSPASRGLVAQLIYNMMYECKVYSPVEISGGSTGTGGNSNLIDSKDNSKSDDGVLQGVLDFSLTGETVTRTKALIDGELYELGDCKYEDLKEIVGYHVEFSYEDSNKKPLKKVRVSSDNNKIDIEDWQIANIDDNSIEYYENKTAQDKDETTTLRFGNKFYVVYNGKVVSPDKIDSEFIKKYLNIDSGDITFLSNDGNAKTVEVAFVTSYVTYFVNTPSTTSGVTTIYDKNKAVTGLEDLKLNENDVESVKVITTAGGNATNSSLTAITAKSVASIAIPYDTTEGTNIVFSKAYVSGTVDQMSNDGYDDIKIGGKEYEISPYFEYLLDNGGSTVDVSFSRGDSGKFYLDYKGRITFYEKTDSSNPYGLLIAYATKNSGVDSDLMVKVNTLNGSTKLEYKLKDNVKVNGTTMTAERAVEYFKENYKAINGKESENGFIIQPIRYATSTSNGETVFSAFETIDNESLSSGKIVPYGFNNSVNENKEMFANGGSLTYNSYSFKKGENVQFKVNSSTVVYLVPYDLTNNSGYKKATYSYFSNGYSYVVEPYDIENGNTAKYVICYLKKDQTSSTKINTGTPVSFIESVSQYTHEGSETYKIAYYQPGSADVKEAVVDPDKSDIMDKVSKLQPGDVIKFATDSNLITNVQTVYYEGALTAETGSVQNGNPNHIRRDDTTGDKYYQAIRGTIYDLDEEASPKTIDTIPYFVGDEKFNAEGIQTIEMGSNVTYFKYNTKTKKFETTSSGEIKKYADFADSNPEEATQAIVFSNNKRVVAVYILDK